MRLTVRRKGGRSEARGAKNKAKSGDMALQFMRDAAKPEHKPKSYPPEVRLRKLHEMLRQCKLAYENTGSWTAKKKIVLIEEHIKLAEAEMNLPSVW